MEDLVVIGAGASGLTAARFAAPLGAGVVLVEKEQVGSNSRFGSSRGNN